MDSSVIHARTWPLRPIPTARTAEVVGSRGICAELGDDNMGPRDSVTGGAQGMARRPRVSAQTAGGTHMIVSHAQMAGVKCWAVRRSWPNGPK